MEYNLQKILNHYALYLKVTQYYKSITLYFFKKSYRKERILKAAGEKQLALNKEPPPNKTIRIFFSRNFAGQEGVAQCIWSAKRKNFQEHATQQSYHSELKEQEFSDKQKLREFLTTKLSL